MKPVLSSVLGGYVAIVTAGAGYLAITAASPPALIPEINVERINIREPDGTLRLAISDHAHMPGLIYDGREYRHPDRPEAGMIFYNDEGSENGGLIFNGSLKGALPTNEGSLTFDRWHQDQTVQLVSTENGSEREAAIKINDRPDRPMDLSRAAKLMTMPNGPAKTAALHAAGLEALPRVYLGRTPDKDSVLMLRDGTGRPRLELAVTEAGNATIRFLDQSGRVTRTIAAP
ncbi:MAG TPA: hypothetical protein VHS33_04320 [Sphingomicrobium sp.]|jgi:hypothetical protein|nr:hypothetical protein [Sphingomicrobium sp.]